MKTSDSKKLKSQMKATIIMLSLLILMSIADVTLLILVILKII